MDLNKAANDLAKFKLQLERNPKEAFEAANLDRGMKACADILKCFRVIAAPEGQKVLYDLNKHLALTLNSFYNETVSFILDDKKRKSGYKFYETLFDVYHDDIAASKTTRTSESIGGSILASMLGRHNLVHSRGPSHQTTELDTRLLSYADQELFALYVTRKNGVIDMVETLYIFLKIAHPL